MIADHSQKFKAAEEEMVAARRLSGPAGSTYAVAAAPRIAAAAEDLENWEYRICQNQTLKDFCEPKNPPDYADQLEQIKIPHLDKYHKTFSEILIDTNITHLLVSVSPYICIYIDQGGHLNLIGYNMYPLRTLTPIAINDLFVINKLINPLELDKLLNYEEFQQNTNAIITYKGVKQGNIDDDDIVNYTINEIDIRNHIYKTFL